MPSTKSKANKSTTKTPMVADKASKPSLNKKARKAKEKVKYQKQKVEIDIEFQPEREVPVITKPVLRKRSPINKAVKQLTRANPIAARQVNKKKKITTAQLLKEKSAQEKIRADEKLLFGSKISDTLNSLDKVEDAAK